MPSQMATGDAPFEGRDFHVHNAALTAVRTTEQDLQLFADHMAGILADAKGPVSFYVPLGGFSSHDSTEGNLYHPELPPIFAQQCEETFPSNVDLHVVDAHINDAAFADALIAATLPFIRKLATSQAMAHGEAAAEAYPTL